MKTTVSLPSVFLFLRGISPSLPVLLWCGAAFRSGLVLPSPPSFLEVLLSSYTKKTKGFPQGERREEVPPKRGRGRQHQQTKEQTKEHHPIRTRGASSTTPKEEEKAAPQALVHFEGTRCRKKRRRDWGTKRRTVVATEKQRNPRERTEGGEQQGLSPSPNMSRDNIDEILLEDVTWL